MQQPFPAVFWGGVGGVGSGHFNSDALKCAARGTYVVALKVGICYCVIHVKQTAVYTAQFGNKKMMAFLLFFILSLTASLFVITAAMLSSRLSRHEAWAEQYDSAEASGDQSSTLCAQMLNR